MRGTWFAYREEEPRLRPARSRAFLAAFILLLYADSVIGHGSLRSSIRWPRARPGAVSHLLPSMFTVDANRTKTELNDGTR